MKGERVFHRGGIMRVAVVLAWIAFAIVFTWLLRGPYDAVFNWLWPVAG